MASTEIPGRASGPRIGENDARCLRGRAAYGRARTDSTQQLGSAEFKLALMTLQVVHKRTTRDQEEPCVVSS